MKTYWLEVSELHVQKISKDQPLLTDQIQEFKSAVVERAIQTKYQICPVTSDEATAAVLVFQEG